MNYIAKIQWHHKGRLFDWKLGLQNSGNPKCRLMPTTQFLVAKWCLDTVRFYQLMNLGRLPVIIQAVISVRDPGDPHHKKNNWCVLEFWILRLETDPDYFPDLQVLSQDNENDNSQPQDFFCQRRQSGIRWILAFASAAMTVESQPCVRQWSYTCIETIIKIKTNDVF